MSLLEEALRRQEELNRKKAQEPESPRAQELEESLELRAKSLEEQQAGSAAPNQAAAKYRGGAAPAAQAQPSPEPAPNQAASSQPPAAGSAAPNQAAAKSRDGAAPAAQAAPSPELEPSPAAHAAPSPRLGPSPRRANDAAAFEAEASKLRRSEPRTARPNVLMMPVIAIIVLVVLIYAKKMISPASGMRAEPSTVQESDSSHLAIEAQEPEESLELRADSSETQQAGSEDGRAVSMKPPQSTSPSAAENSHVDAESRSTNSVLRPPPSVLDDGRASRPAPAASLPSVTPDVGPEGGRVGTPLPAGNSLPNSGPAVIPESEVAASSQSLAAGPAASNQAAAKSRGGAAPAAQAQPEPKSEPGPAPAAVISRGGAAPAAQAQPNPESEQEPLTWPEFKLKTIAAGKNAKNSFVMLDTGEMLAVGERTKKGVRVESIKSEVAVFSWKTERKTLRCGESSDKPADQD